MDELEIDGKKYLSSRRAAKEHKYHIDYIGQLIRAGKVVGKKVGRSWYVEQGSLKNYLTQEADGKTVEASSTAAEEEVKTPEPTPIEEVSAPIISRTEIIEEKIIQPIVHSATSTEQKISEEAVSSRKVYFSTPEKEQAPHSTLTYVADDEPMLPVLNGRMRANADFVAVPVRRVQEEEVYDEKDEEEISEEAIPRSPRHSLRFETPRTTVLVSLIGLLALAAAIGSTFLVTSIKVQEGQPASVGIGIK